MLCVIIVCFSVCVVLVCGVRGACVYVCCVCVVCIICV